eukprot:5073640-Pyramimonas_sp.AAC.1
MGPTSVRENPDIAKESRKLAPQTQDGPQSPNGGIERRQMGLARPKALRGPPEGLRGGGKNCPPTITRGLKTAGKVP